MSTPVVDFKSIKISIGYKINIGTIEMVFISKFAMTILYLFYNSLLIFNNNYGGLGNHYYV